MADLHISPNRVYYLVFGTLAVLTAVTVWVAFQDYGIANDVVALGIAITKAAVVVLFFMHVKYAPRLVQVVVAAGFLWLLILFGLILVDYQTRQTIVADPAPVKSLVLPPG